MSNLYRIVYQGVAEIWVEAQGQTITRVLSASAGGLAGKQLDDLPTPAYVEAKLMAKSSASEEACCCCRLGLEVEIAQCGHAFCYICRGRGHNRPEACVECNPSNMEGDIDEPHEPNVRHVG